MRLPFLIPLLLAGVAAFAVSFLLGIGLVLLFGRAFLMGAHRRPAFGGSDRSGGGSGTALASAERGRDGDGEPSLIELLPLP